MATQRLSSFVKFVMATSVPRIQSTPLSQLSYDMVVKLADLKGCSAASIVAHALEVWLQENYEKELSNIDSHHVQCLPRWNKKWTES